MPGPLALGAAAGLAALAIPGRAHFVPIDCERSSSENDGSAHDGEKSDGDPNGDPNRPRFINVPRQS